MKLGQVIKMKTFTLDELGFIGRVLHIAIQNQVSGDYHQKALATALEVQQIHNKTITAFLDEALPKGFEKFNYDQAKNFFAQQCKKLPTLG